MIGAGVCHAKGGTTVNNEAPVMLWIVALIVADPSPTLCTSPPALTVAAEVLDDFQVTVLVTSTLLPSAYSPVAVSWMAVPW